MEGRDDLYVRCVAKPVLANRGTVLGITAWCNDGQVKLDDGLYKTKMLDKELWDKWKVSAKSTMNIPKIKKVWDKTKDIHTHEFVKFVESL